MSESYFTFKQFSVSHSRCGMKVGTDGVLLGAWADIENCQTILDVGTGCGLIALMVAQRNNKAFVTAIDIDVEAVKEARENAESSIFGNRIEIINNSLLDFSECCTQKFDTIITNPPFFTDGLLSPDRARADARHAYSMPYKEIFRAAKFLLTGNGKLSIIYPITQRDVLVEEARLNDLFVCRETVVLPTPESLPKRVLLEFSRLPLPNIISNELVIEVERHKYSEEYKTLVSEFYLNV